VLKRNFTTVKHAKPPASRKDSSEWYVIAQGFKGIPPRSGEDFSLTSFRV
jgi:23S rRNA (uridine2552-2'-O)-methyltransferase